MTLVGDNPGERIVVGSSSSPAVDTPSRNAVTDLTFERSLRGRLLGYGTLIVESAGQIQALNRIDYIPRPEEVYEALPELVFGDKGKTRATGLLARPRWRR